MSDCIKHECAVTLLRLRKKPEYYQAKYGTRFYGFQKLTLLLEKQHNRGQDGAGIAAIKLNPQPGCPAFVVEKSASGAPLADLLERMGKSIAAVTEPDRSPLAGELLLGHLRYGTFGRQGVGACHPFVRENACLERTLLLAGNFNLTDTAEIFEQLLITGHHPASRQDGALILGLIGHYLEQALTNRHDCDLGGVLQRAAGSFDGAFTLCGMLADGKAFALRDAAGIRPGFYYVDDEVVVVASERPAIQTAFDLPPEQVKPLPPGDALLIDPRGEVSLRRCLPVRPLRQCVFERIYFSRGNDADIYRERKALGRALLPQILAETGGDLEHTFFSYIPNTAQISFLGLLESLLKLPGHPEIRFGQIAVKDAKFRTFITNAAARKDFFKHIYDVTYGQIAAGVDTLVVLDDSIVRGNTMRNAILPMLDRLKPRKIVVVSAAPPIAYPDCYGIDMASLKELVAFEALIALLEQARKQDLLEECYRQALGVLNGGETLKNWLTPLYEQFSFETLSQAIGDRLRPAGLRAQLSVIFQRVEALKVCCPEYSGDWYFTGDYPTPGGYRVVNRALVNYMEKIDGRAY